MDVPFTIEQRMTTPTRPGKQPRPVWVAIGTTIGYEEHFKTLGGKKYHGLWSFFRDPSDELDGLQPQIFAERQEERADRAEARADRAEEYGSNAARRAQTAFDRAHQIGDAIPLGQPILVGHHSERRARADVNRIDNAMRRGVDEQRKAGYWDGRADAAEQTAKIARGEVSLGYAMRRLEDAQRDARLTQATIDGTRRAYGGEKPTGEAKVRLAAMVADATDRAAYWQTTIDALGGPTYGPHTIKVGDLVNRRRVVRVNKKSVSVETEYSWTDTISYDKVRTHRPAETLDEA